MSKASTRTDKVCVRVNSGTTPSVAGCHPCPRSSWNLLLSENFRKGVAGAKEACLTKPVGGIIAMR